MSSVYKTYTENEYQLTYKQASPDVGPKEKGAKKQGISIIIWPSLTADNNGDFEFNLFHDFSKKAPTEAYGAKIRTSPKARITTVPSLGLEL